MRQPAVGAMPMADADSHAAAGTAAPSGASPEKATLTGTLVHLWPYIWPGDRADLKMRVVWSMVLLLAAKRRSCGRKLVHSAVSFSMGEPSPLRRALIIHQ